MTAVPARFGASGTRVHLAAAVETAGRWRLTTTVPACGAYTRPGSGWPLPGAEVTCTRCAKLAVPPDWGTDEGEAMRGVR